MKLYRAVGEEEFRQLMQTGRFAAGPNSVVGKHFAERAEHAAQWGERLHGAGRYRIVEADVPDDDADQFVRSKNLDSIGPARFAELAQLSRAVVREVKS